MLNHYYFIVNKYWRMNKLTDISQRLTKQQRLYERQKEFYNRGSSVTSIPQYNALQDQHSLQYFLKNPVKKNLKKFLKAVSLQPQTHQKAQTIKSLSHLLNLNYDKKKKNLATLSIQGEQSQKSKSKRHYTQKSSFNETAINKEIQKSLVDPYLEVFKTSILEKKNKIKLSILKRKEITFKQRFMNENMQKYDEKEKKKSRKKVELQSLNFQRRSTVVSSSSGKQTKKYMNSQTFLKFINEKKQKIQPKVVEQEYKMDEFQA